MTLDELKSELDVRNVNYDDCFSKSELAGRLKESRLSGKADPSIIDKFNALEIDDNILNDDDMMSQVKAQDGSLVGGLTPEQMKKLSSNPEIMAMLKDEKLQKMMKDVMQNGQQSLQKYLSDPDAIVLLKNLSQIMGKLMN